MKRVTATMGSVLCHRQESLVATHTNTLSIRLQGQSLHINCNVLLFNILILINNKNIPLRLVFDFNKIFLLLFFEGHIIYAFIEL